MMEPEIISYLVEKIAADAEPDRDEGLTFPEFDLDWETGDRAALFDKASQSMQKNGCVILRNFLSTEEAGGLLESLEELLSREEIATPIDKRMDYETDDYLALRDCNIDLYKRFSDELKSTTFNFWDRRREVKFLGKAGDFGMTFQRGAHRGWPQKSGHHRYALVQTFMPEGMEP